MAKLVYPDVYGYIKKDYPSTYTAYDQSGTEKEQQVQKISAGHHMFALYSFDTSSIPTNATVNSVTFRIYITGLYEDIGLDVDSYILRFYYEADRVGAAITTDDWWFTTPGAQKIYGDTPPSLPYSDDITMPTGTVNKGGDTDIDVRDYSAYSGAPDGPRWGFKARISGSRMWLDIDYTVPRGLFNRWNWRLPALPGFSNVIAAVVLPSGELKVLARFYPRPLEV